MTDAEKELQKTKDKGYLKTMTEKQWLMMTAGAAIGATTGAIAGSGAGGVGAGPGAITGGLLGGLGGAIGGLIYGYAAHKAALEAAEEAVTEAEDDLAKKRLELANCILKQSENDITPTSHGVSIRYSPTHTVNISTNDPIKRIHMYVTPAEISNSGNSVTTVKEKDGGFSGEISHTFTPNNGKGTYNVEISVEFYGHDDKVLYKAYQIYVDD